MSPYIQDDGGIAVAPETTWNTHDTETFVWQHAKSASLVPQHPIIIPTRLATTRPTPTYDILTGQGDIAVFWNKSRAVVADLMELYGVLSTNDYLIDGSAPDGNSVTVRINHGGVMWQYTGFKASAMRWHLVNGDGAMFTVEGIAAGVSEQTVVAPSPPADSGIYMPSDVGTITLNSAQLCVMDAAIAVEWPLQGADRKCLGASAIKEQVLTGYPNVTAALQMELAEVTGDNTVDIINALIAGTSLGSLVFASDFTLTNCYVTGDGASLGPGIGVVSVSVTADSLTVTTTT